jgi:hypothetical protein
MALTMALVQVQRDGAPSPNLATVCVLALARLTGKYDYTAQDEDEGVWNGGH